MNSCPYKNCKIQQVSQLFKNGHQAVDWCPKNPYGTPLVAPCNGVVESIRTDTNIYDEFWAPFGKGYGIVIKDDDDQSYNLYWHCLQVFPVEVGERVTKGRTVIAQMGNSGICYSDGIEVPLEKRLKPPYPGTHLHQERYLLDGNNNKTYYDPLMFTDFGELVNPNMLDYIKKVVQKMIDLIKGR
jgi:murein DD-endopeptidase MepM/ murein hydrolase activator NlpD